MVRQACFDMNGIKSGVWSKEEDDTLRAFVQKHGHHNWQKLPFLAGLKRSGKSCRLRWVNYLQPGLRKGNFSNEEEDLIITLHNQLGNKWATIAENFPGRTDNDIKNHWHAHIKKRGKRTRAEMGVHDEQQLFEIMNCRKKSNHQHENTNVEAQVVFNDFELGYNDTPDFSHSSDSDDHTCFSQFDVDLSPLIPQEEFSTFGLHYNDTPTFSDSSNIGGITYDHNHACFDQISINLPPLYPEEEFSGFGLCHNGTPTFSDSSDGGSITCFSQLNVPHFSEEEFNDLGLCYSDGTPTFSNSSDGSGIAYDHDTCFSQFNNVLTPFLEEEGFIYDLGLCYNDTPNFSGITSLDSILENHNEVFGLNNLERIWYFGDDV